MGFLRILLHFLNFFLAFVVVVNIDSCVPDLSQPKSHSCSWQQTYWSSYDSTDHNASYNAYTCSDHSSDKTVADRFFHALDSFLFGLLHSFIVSVVTILFRRAQTKQVNHSNWLISDEPIKVQPT